MTLLLYAIADRRHVIPEGLAGLGGHAVRGVSAGELVAIVDDGPAPREVTPEALLRFEEVVESLMGDGTVLPARFGTVLDDDEAGRRLLTDRHRRLAGALRRVGGGGGVGGGGWISASAPSGWRRRSPPGSRIWRGTARCASWRGPRARSPPPTWFLVP